MARPAYRLLRIVQPCWQCALCAPRALAAGKVTKAPCRCPSSTEPGVLPFLPPGADSEAAAAGDSRGGMWVGVGALEWSRL